MLNYIFCCVILSVATFALLRLVINKIPNLVDAFIVLTIYYNALIPIFNTLNPEFVATYGLTDEAKNLNYVTGQFMIIIQAIFFTYLGYSIFLFKTKKQYAININDKTKSKLIILAVCLFIITAIVYLSIPKGELGVTYNFVDDEVPDFYAQSSIAIVTFLSLLKLTAIIIMMLNIMDRFIAKSKRRYFVHGFAAFAVILAVVLGKRLEVIMVVGLIYLFDIITRLTTAKKILYGILAILLFTIIGITRFGFDRLGSLDLSEIAILPLFEGFVCNHTFTGYYEFIQQGHTHYQYGSQFLEIPFGIIPRFIFPYKNELVGVSTSFLQREAAPLGGGSLLADVYLQGGAIVVCLFYFLLGAFFRFIQIKKEDLNILVTQKKLDLKLVIYLVTFTLFLLNMREGLIVCCKTYLQILLFTLFIFYIVKNISFMGKKTLGPSTL